MSGLSPCQIAGTHPPLPIALMHLHVFNVRPREKSLMNGDVMHALKLWLNLCSVNGTFFRSLARLLILIPC